MLIHYISVTVVYPLDTEKITSVYIHILPAMLYYCLRWYDPEHGRDERQPLTLNLSDYLLASALYLLWQTMYFVKTEVVDRQKLDRDPEYITSLRWMSRDSKSSISKLVLNLMRLFRIFKHDEGFDPSSVKTKLIFVASQFIYTLAMFGNSFFVFYSKIANLLFIAALFTISIYFGASYYIDIFSQRYQLQFGANLEMSGNSEAKKAIIMKCNGSSTSADDVEDDEAESFSTDEAEKRDDSD